MSVEAVVAAAVELRDRTVPLTAPLEQAPFVLNPLDYAWEAHLTYLRRYSGLGARTVWLGMNPGPWGMAQTGVPFGSIPRVRGFLGIDSGVVLPKNTHPARPVLGFDCERVEVSGDRLWGTVQDVCKTPATFFGAHFVTNYCPLVWQSEKGRNITPDKLPTAAMKPVFEACDDHLRAVVGALKPEMVVAVGVWSEKRIRAALGKGFEEVAVGRILHPSPASPAANRGWAAAATQQLEELGHPLPRG